MVSTVFFFRQWKDPRVVCSKDGPLYLAIYVCVNRIQHFEPGSNIVVTRESFHEVCNAK